MPACPPKFHALLVICCWSVLAPVSDAWDGLPIRSATDAPGAGSRSPATTSSPGASCPSMRRSAGRKSGPRCSSGSASSRFAYDWRGEHIPTLRRRDGGAQAARHRADAFWFPARPRTTTPGRILDLLKRHEVKTQLWVTMGDPAPQGDATSRPTRSTAAAACSSRSPRGRARSAARSPSTTTAAGSASRKTSSRSSSELEAAERRHRLQPAPRPRPSRPLPGTAQEDDAAPAAP